MPTFFSPKIARILDRSGEEAVRLYSRSIGPEHLMLGILGDMNNSVCTALNRMNVNLQAMKMEIEQSIREGGMFEDVHASKMELNDEANNIMRIAIQEAQKQNKKVVGESHLMLALLNENNPNALLKILNGNNINYQA